MSKTIDQAADATATVITLLNEQVTAAPVGKPLPELATVQADVRSAFAKVQASHAIFHHFVTKEAAQRKAAVSLFTLVRLVLGKAGQLEALALAYELELTDAQKANPALALVKLACPRLDPKDQSYQAAVVNGLIASDIPPEAALAFIEEKKGLRAVAELGRKPKAAGEGAAAKKDPLAHQKSAITGKAKKLDELDVPQTDSGFFIILAEAAEDGGFNLIASLADDKALPGLIRQAADKVAEEAAAKKRLRAA